MAYSEYLNFNIKQIQEYLDVKTPQVCPLTLTLELLNMDLFHHDDHVPRTLGSVHRKIGFPSLLLLLPGKSQRLIIICDLDGKIITAHA